VPRLTACRHAVAARPTGLSIGADRFDHCHMDCIQPPSRAQLACAPCVRVPQRGFTLIELLVTLVVAGILLAVGVPAMTNFLATRSSIANAEELVEALRFARSEAIKRSSPVMVCSTTEPNAATPACGGASDWMSGWVVIHSASNRVLRVQNGIRSMKEINATAASVTFQATGIAVAASFEFVPVGEAVDERVRTVDLNVQGRAQLLKGKAPA